MLRDTRSLEGCTLPEDEEDAALDGWVLAVVVLLRELVRIFHIFHWLRLFLAWFL